MEHETHGDPQSKSPLPGSTTLRHPAAYAGSCPGITVSSHGFSRKPKLAAPSIWANAGSVSASAVHHSKHDSTVLLVRRQCDEDMEPVEHLYAFRNEQHSLPPDVPGSLCMVGLSPKQSPFGRRVEFAGKLRVSHPFWRPRHGFLKNKPGGAMIEIPTIGS